MNLLWDGRQFPLRVEAASATGDAWLDALLHEREGYVQRGLSDRVAQVDEQLRQRGYCLDPDGGKGGTR